LADKVELVKLVVVNLTYKVRKFTDTFWILQFKYTSYTRLVIVGYLCSMSSAAVDPCMYLPCIHGQCESHPTVDILNYTCSCDAGYTGPLCVIGKILFIIPRALVDIILKLDVTQITIMAWIG